MIENPRLIVNNLKDSGQWPVVSRIESRKHEMKRKTRKRNLFLNPPLKRRAITICPFKGAFENSLSRLGKEISRLSTLFAIP